MLRIEPRIYRTGVLYELTPKELGVYLKELKKTQKEIEKYDFTFELMGLCNKETKEKVLNIIKEDIKLCEHYFKTKKRKDLFKWNFAENLKPHDWSEERNVWSYSNGKLKAVIDIFNREKSTEITGRIEFDCELYIHFQKTETKKNLRSGKSIKEYLFELKKSYLEELKKFGYKTPDKEFLDFILN